MMSLGILWTLLFVATVKARSEVSIADAALSAENSRSEVPFSEAEENSLKNDANHQKDIEEAILNRMGFDALTHSIDNDDVNLDKAFEEKLHGISDTLSRFSGIEPNEVSDTNFDSLVAPKSGIVNSDLYNHHDNLRNDVLKILDSGVDDVSVLGGLHRNGLLNVHNRNLHNVNPVNVFQSRSHLSPYFNVDPNVESDHLSTRIASLNGAKDSKLNNLLLTKSLGQSPVFRRNHVLDAFKHGSGRRFTASHGLTNNDVENVKISDQDVAAIDEIVGKSSVDTENVYTNDEHLNTRRSNSFNNLVSNVLDDKIVNSDIDAELASIVNARSGHNGFHHEHNKIGSSVDDSNIVNIVDQLSRHGAHNNRHGIKISSLDDLNQVKHAINNLESNVFHSKTGVVGVDHDLSSIIANVRAGHALNDFHKIGTLDDDFHDVNVFEHQSKHGLSNNRNGIQKVSLNDLNDAKKLLGPLSFDKVAANRVGNEIDGALLNALNADDDFNALGALAVLNKAAAKASEKYLLNNVIGRSDTDVESNLISKFGAISDSDVNGVTSNNPLDEVVNNLVALSRIDASNDAVSSINSEYSPEHLSRSHKNLLHGLVDSKWGSNRIEHQNSDAEVDDVDSLLSRGSYGLNLKRYGVRYKPTSPYNLYKRNRPLRINRVPIRRPRFRSLLNKDESHNDLVELSKRAKLNNVANSRHVQFEHSLEDILSGIDKSGASDVSDLSERQLENLIALHDHAQVNARNHLNHVHELDDEKSVRQSVSKLDKELRDAKSLLLASSLSNLKDQRRKVAGKSNFRFRSGEEESKYEDVVLVPVKVGSSVVSRHGGPYDITDFIDWEDIH